VRETFSRDGLLTLARLLLLYLFVSVFWSLFDQTGSAWVLQAKSMDRVLFGTEILPAQIQAANPLLVMLLVPTFSYLVNFAIEGRGVLQGADYYGFFTLLMLATAGLFALVSRHIPEYTRLQHEAPKNHTSVSE
jgi:POT family proton-dependent oligopeptide transporter